MTHNKGKIVLLEESCCRLSEDAKLIMSDLMEKLHNLHLQSLGCNVLNSNNVLVKGHEVLLNCDDVHVDDGVIECDFRSVSAIIYEMVGTKDTTKAEFPQDLRHLVECLESNQSCKKQELIINHPALWSKWRSIRNILLLHLVCEHSGTDTQKAIGRKANVPETIAVEWRTAIRGTCYETLKDKHTKIYAKYHIDAVLIMAFTRHALSHFRELKIKSVEVAEAKIHALCPSFMAYFIGSLAIYCVWD